MDELRGKCRLCLRKRCGAKDVFERINGEESYSDFIMATFRIQLHEGDNWPSMACKGCIRSIDQMRDLKETIASNEQELAEMFMKAEPVLPLEELLPTTLDHIMDNDVSEPVPVFIDPTKTEDSHQEEMETNSLEKDKSPEPTPSKSRRESVKRNSQHVSCNERKQLDKDMFLFGLLLCQHCKLQTNSYGDFKKHTTTVHRQREPLFECCDRTFEGARILQHMKYHRNPDLYKCDECSKRMLTGCELTKHKTRLHPVKKRAPPPPPPGQTLQRKSHPTPDMILEQQPTNSTLYLDAWDRQEVDKEMLARNFLFCEECKLPTYSYTEFRKHAIRVHQHREVSFKCCDRTFEAGRMLQHMKYHLDPDVYKCDECDKRMLTRYDLIQHNTTQSHLIQVRLLGQTTKQSDLVNPSSPEQEVNEHPSMTPEPVADLEPVEDLEPIIPESVEDIKPETSESVEGLESEQPSIPDQCAQKQTITASQYVEESERDDLDTELLARDLLDCTNCPLRLKSYAEFKRHSTDAHKLRDPIFRCCKKNFEGARVLQHMKYHRNPDLYKCDDCGKNLLSRYDLINHQKKHPDTTNLSVKEMNVQDMEPKQSAIPDDCVQKQTIRRSQYVDDEERDDLDTELLARDLLDCKNCPLRLKSYAEFKRHSTDAHKLRDPIFRCCKKNFEGARVLQHMKYHRNPDLYKCDECEKRYFSRHELISHQKKLHPNKVNLTGSEEIISEISSPVDIKLQQPSTSDMLSRLIVSDIEREELDMELFNRDLLGCQECQLQTRSYAELKRHSTDAHQLREPIFRCCERNFDGARVLQHMKYHRNPDLYKCGVCGKKFLSRNDLIGHKRKGVRCVSMPAPVPRVCRTCGEEFLTAKEMQRHIIKKHPNQQNYVCEVCGKSYALLVRLVEHRARHEERVSQECPICHKFYFNLPRHRREQHEGLAKIHVCKICGESTTRLSRHMVRHNVVGKQKQYPCQVCDKAFNFSHQLKKHMNIHLGIRSKCYFCPHEATNKGNLSNHMRAKHWDEYEQHKARRLTTPRVKNPRLEPTASNSSIVPVNPNCFNSM